MTTNTHRGMLLLTFAIGSAACDGQSPVRPTPLPRVVPSAPTVTAISPSTGSTVRTTPVTISGTGFLAGATVTVDARVEKVVIVNSTTITAIVPARPAGAADVVVTNPGGLSGALAAAFIYSLEEPVMVTPGIEAVDAGGQLSVSWTAPGAGAGDWIALFPVGGSYDDDWWGETDGATSGTLTVIAPTRPGQYEFRYLLGGSFNDLARSSAVTVR
jgi:IPT/TIG domain